MLQEPYYAHKELMAELGLTTKKLPSELKSNVITFNQKKRFAKNPDLIIELQNFSELIAGEIQAWHMANEETEPIVEEEVVEEEVVEEETEPIVEETEPIVEETEPIVEETEPITEETEPIAEETEPIAEETPKAEKSNGGWGIDTSW